MTWHRLPPLVLLLLLVGCPKKKEVPPPPVPDAGPVQRAEQEPNDRPEQAMAIGESTVVAASLGSTPSKPDEDWYLLFSDAPRSVDLTVSGIPGTDVQLELFDRDRNRLVAVNGQGEGGAERIPDLLVRGKLLVRVSAVRKGGGGAYALTALFSDPRAGWEAEPNDRAADSTELHFGEAAPDAWTVLGLVAHPGDEDWYRVVLATPEADAGAPAPGSLSTTVDAGSPATREAQGFPSEPPPPEGLGAAADAGTPPAEEPRITLRLELTAVPGVRPEVQVLSEAQAPLFSARGKEGDAFSQRNVAVRATDRVVYVVVKSAWTGTGKEGRRGANPDQPYTLTVSREAAGANAEYEPNDDLAHATPLPLNGFREGFLTPKTDVDEYVLRPGAPVIARFELSGVDRLDLVLSLVEPGAKPGTERVIVKANDGAVKAPERLNSIACSTVCFVKVEGALRKVDGKWTRDFENAEQPYRLTVTTTPDTGSEEHEPNDTLALATPVSLGKPVRGTIHPKKDVDYFRLDLSDRQVKTALKSTLTGILKVDVALFLYRQDDDGSLTLVQTSDRGKGDAPEVIHYAADPGVYLFKVQDTKNRESNFQDSYQLSVEESE